jgi:hypothetical protein
MCSAPRGRLQSLPMRCARRAEEPHRRGSVSSSFQRLSRLRDTIWTPRELCQCYHTDIIALYRPRHGPCICFCRENAANGACTALSVSSPVGAAQHGPGANLESGHRVRLFSRSGQGALTLSCSLACKQQAKYRRRTSARQSAQPLIRNTGIASVLALPRRMDGRRPRRPLAIALGGQEAAPPGASAQGGRGRLRSQ